MNSKFFWRFLQLGAICLWIFSLGLGFWFYPEYQMKAWSLFIVVVIIHTSELLLTLRMDSLRNKTTKAIVVNTVLFGFTWWVPVKNGIFE